MKAVLSLNNLTKRYPESKSNVLDGITLDIPAGCIVGVIGKNGAGKSTLFRCITGLEPLDGGTIRINGESLSNKDLRKRRKEMGIVFQQLHLFSARTVRENLSYPLEIHGIPKKEREERIDELLAFLGLEAKEGLYPAQLSGGEKQRAAFGRAIAARPKILLCDEATSALDPDSLKTVVELLKRLQKEWNLTILLIAHQLELVQAVCTNIVKIEGGKLCPTN